MSDAHRDARSLCPLDHHDIHALMPFKRALAAQYPVPEAFAWYREMLGLPAGARIAEKPLVPLGEHAAANGLVYRELAPSGVPFSLEPPKVVGAGVVPPASYTTRASFVACVPDVLARGRSSLLETQYAALQDAEPRERADVDDWLEVEPGVFHAGAGSVAIIENATEAIVIPEAFVSLLGVSSRAFGHWLWQYLPAYLTAHGSGALPPVPILIDAGMPRQHRQALELFVPGDARIIEVEPGRTLAIGRAWLASALSYVPSYYLPQGDEAFECPHYECAPPERFAVALAAMRACAARTPATGKARVYLARRSNGRHDLVNADEVEAALAARGFVTVHPEDLDFAEQIRLVQHADYLVGAEGAALYLAFFAHPGAKVADLCQNRVFGDSIALTAILASIDVDVTLVTGEIAGRPEFGYPIFAHFRLDVPAFEQFLGAWLA